MTQPAGIRKADRIAVIDVGSNSVKLSIAVPGGRRPIVIETARIVSQLGQGASADGVLDADSIERTADAVCQLVSEARLQDCCQICVVATSAAREAPNGAVLKQRVKALADIDLEIISGTREAALIFHAVSGHHVVAEQRCMAFDTGGGSTELVRSDHGKFLGGWSVPLGSLRLTQRFETTGQVCSSVVDAIRGEVCAVIKASPVNLDPPEVLVGTGGTCTTMALLDIGPLPINRKDKPPSVLRENHTMSLESVEHTLHWLRRMESDERREKTGLGSRRSDIIVAGVCIVAELMTILESNWIVLMDVGLRDGLLRELIG